MEVIFMNTMYTTTRILDVFSSLIWNDAYIGEGDFELRFPMDENALAGIREGWYASIRESEKCMIVEGIEIDTSVTEGNYVVLTGRSFESILRRRVILEDTILSGDFQTGIMRLINANFTGTGDTDRDITKIVYRVTDDPFITGLKLEAEHKKGENLYEIICAHCDEYKVGFRMLPDYEHGYIFLELYRGVDRSYDQEENPWVVFSPKFENIQNTSMIMSTMELKNYIVMEATYTYKDTDDNTVEAMLHVEVGDANGMDRREMYATSSIKPDEVKLEDFGTPEDRVDKEQYMGWEAVYFDRDAYNEAMGNYQKKLNAAYVPRKEESTHEVWVEYKPGDEGYIGDQPGISAGDPARVNGYWKLETVPGDTVEEWQAKNSKYHYIQDNCEPQQEEFYKYAWVLVDETGYKQALAQAQQDIYDEYNAALEDARGRAEDALYTEAREMLAPYLKISEFDGEVDPNVQFLYGRDYYLGDVVQVVNEFNFQATTRIVGMEFSEEEGTGTIKRPVFASDDKAVFDIL